MAWGSDPDGPEKTKEEILQERAKEALKNADPEDVARLQQFMETQQNILAVDNRNSDCGSDRSNKWDERLVFQYPVLVTLGSGLSLWLQAVELW